jgi:hypothetical protein
MLSSTSYYHHLFCFIQYFYPVLEHSLLFSLLHYLKVEVQCEKLKIATFTLYGVIARGVECERNALVILIWLDNVCA